MAAKRVLIRNRDGEEYSVTEADFRSDYAETSFTIQSYEDGSEYEDDPKTGQPSKDSATDKAKE